MTSLLSVAALLLGWCFAIGQAQFGSVSLLQPPPVVQGPALAGFGGGQAGADYSHRAVLINAAMEAQLPDNLKNPFYRNPRIAEALAKESWFGPGEKPVSQREAEKIPRERIFSVLKNAGLARRRRR